MTQHLNNVQVATENRNIIRQNCYELNGHTIHFRHTLEEQQKVEAITPEDIAYIMSPAGKSSLPEGNEKDPEIIVVNADSFTPETDLVMNFANGYNPGGGYLNGAVAQEEALCRESTLYASISSESASVMYTSNETSQNPFNTDYMLISPCVEIFRDQNNQLLESTRTTAVLTIAAPNLLYDPKMRSVTQNQIDDYMLMRIRQFFTICAVKKCRSLTLGAWGCGAFGHDPKKVSGYFKAALYDYNLKQYFNKLVFAIKVGSSTRNYDAFLQTFRDVM